MPGTNWTGFKLPLSPFSPFPSFGALKYVKGQHQPIFSRRRGRDTLLQWEGNPPDHSNYIPVLGKTYLITVGGGRKKEEGKQAFSW